MSTADPRPPRDAGEPETPSDRLFAVVYEELRRLAAVYLGRERAGHTLQPTALVHEAFLRLGKDDSTPWESRGHFFSVAARAMRRILIDHARGRRAAKRGGSRARFQLDEAELAGPDRDDYLMDLDEALERLTPLEPRQARVVELRFFGGLTIEETGKVLGVSHATVEREWKLAKAWLHREITRGEEESSRVLTGMDRKRIKQIFAEAAELPEGTRQGFLDAECGTDTELRSEVESLLDALEQSPTFLETAAFAAFRDFPGPEPGDLAPGKVVGAYRLLEPVASGGMGTVWAGVRDGDDEAERVAIKFVRRGVDSAQVLRRFARERQSLANLDHDNIAALLDAGVTEEGRPFLVMEFVDGQAIDEYCDSNELGLRERLDLFREVCGAVHSAHRNLVVHRDIKPSNILVTEKGAPKLVDFGIAKLLSSEGTGLPSTLTTAGGPPMTPEYASPEQVRGLAITTSSDIYSLGALLFRLLTSRPPHLLRSHLRAEVEKVVCEDEPLRPSEAVLEADEEACRVRGARREALARRLRGDVDNIVLMALRKEPARRYASAQQLAQDVDRHLRGLPVHARGDTMAYLLTKFLRRNRGATAAAVVILLALVAGQQTLSAIGEKQKSFDEMQSQFSLVQLAAGLLRSGINRDGEPMVRVARILEEGEKWLEWDLVGAKDEAKAMALLLLGSIHREYDSLDKAEELLERALVLFTNAHGEDDLHTARAVQELGIVHFQKGEYSVARDHLQRAYELRQRTPRKDDLDVGICANYLGQTYQGLGDNEKAEHYHAIAEEKWRVGLGRGTNPHVTNNLATLKFERGERQAALDMLLADVALEEQRYGADGHRDLATSLNNLGYMQLAMGRLDEALDTLEQALAMQRAVRPAGDPEIAVSINNLAGAHFQRGEFHRAIPLLSEALAIHEAEGPSEHPDALSCRTNLAVAQARTGERDAALETLQPVLAYHRSHEDEDPARLELLEGFAASLQDPEEDPDA